MQINSATMYIFMLLFLIGLQVYCVYHFSGMTLCTFRRRDRTRITKWAKPDQARIEFDGGWYEVETDRITVGIKWLILPMVVKCLDFNWNSTRALNPDNFENTYSPEERKQLDKKDDIRALEQGNQQSLVVKGTRQGMLQQYMPLMTVIGFLIVGYMLWQSRTQQDKLGFALNVVQEQLGRLLQNFPK